MEEKYIVVKGDAENHRSNIDRLDNVCNVAFSKEVAYEDANYFCYNGARRAQVYKLVAEFAVEDVVVTTESGSHTRVLKETE